MPLSGSSIRQSALDSVGSATSVTVGFPEGCAAGNTVVLLVLGAVQPSAVPSGFTQDEQVWVTGGPALTWFRLPVTSGGETSWTVTAAGATTWAWRAVELVGLAVPPLTPESRVGLDGPYDGTTYPGTLFFGVGSGETGSATRLDVVKLGAAGYYGPSNTAAQIAAGTWRAASQNTLGTWSYVGDRSATDGSASSMLAGFWQAFSGNTVAGVGDQLGLGAGLAGGTASDFWWGGYVSYAAAGSAVQDPIVMGTGFEFGTHHGIVGGPVAAPGPAQIADAVSGVHGTAYQVISTAPKNGTYHLRVTAAATVAYVRWTTATLGTGLGQAVFGGYLKCVSATSNPAVLAEFAPAAGTAAQIVYNPTTTKIGVRWGAGTVAYQAGTTPLGSYAWVDLLATFSGTTWVIAWQVEESGQLAAQAKPADLTGQTASTWSTATLGSATSQTMTADYDDICLSNTLGDYPLRRHKVVLLTPDPAVPAVLASTAGANMSAITNNAVGSTLTATGAANVPALLDEVPPNFSSTADGVAVVTAGTADAVVLDMTSYTAAATERIDSVRLYVCGWAASTATASLAVARDTGTSTVETSVVGATVHGTFINTTTGTATVPGWYCKNLPESTGWTQAKLDAQRIKLGFSTDATPDIGALAVYLEVAVSTDFASGLADPTPVIAAPTSPPLLPQQSPPGIY